MGIRCLVLLSGIAILLTYGCQQQDNASLHEQNPSKDTSFVAYTVYAFDPLSLDSFTISDQRSMYMTSTEIGDSLLSFSYYYDDTSLAYSFTITTRNDRFISAVIGNTDPVRCKLTDEVQYSDKGKTYNVTKFEILDPPIDGAGCFLVEKNDGIIGMISYDWGRRTILTEKNDQTISAYRLLLFDNIFDNLMSPHPQE